MRRLATPLGLVLVLSLPFLLGGCPGPVYTGPRVIPPGEPTPNA